LTQTDNFAKTIALALWPFLAMMKKFRFEPFFAHNSLEAFVECFLAIFGAFLILTQTYNFAKAIAFALCSFLAMMKKIRFFEY